jgi:hypothetical protein
MQKNKNIRLLITWIMLLSITIIVSLYRPDNNKIDIDRDHFSLREKVNDITKVTINSSKNDISLSKSGRKWSLNETHTADPSKINDLLGILSEISVRRKAATSIHEAIGSDTTNQYIVTLFADDQIIKSFAVAENESETLTYFIDDFTYVVNIPGYNYHVADIFSPNASQWRTPYVFVSNWTQLDKMLISYPNDSTLNFEIVYDKLGYNIPAVHQLDSSVMYDYMEQISFLQVQNYIPSIDSISRPSDLNIIVKDVGDQQMVLDFYIYPTQAFGLINNQEWAIFGHDQINSLLKIPQDFGTKN